MSEQPVAGSKEPVKVTGFSLKKGISLKKAKKGSKQPKVLLAEKVEEEEDERSFSVTFFNAESNEFATNDEKELERRRKEEEAAKPLVIVPETRDWKADLKQRRGIVTLEEEELKYGLNNVTVKQEDSHKNSTVPVESEREALKNDLNTRPDPPSVETYAKIPVESFGAALLRGMGWDGKSEKGKSGAASEAGNSEEFGIKKPRPAFLGLGAKEVPLAVLNGSGKGNNRGKFAYSPVVLKEKAGGKESGSNVEGKPVGESVFSETGNRGRNVDSTDQQRRSDFSKTHSSRRSPRDGYDSQGDSKSTRDRYRQRD